MHRPLRRARIHVPDAMLERVEFAGADQVLLIKI
jgi:hypothetical protein